MTKKAKIYTVSDFKNGECALLMSNVGVNSCGYNILKTAFPDIDLDYIKVG